MYTMSYTGWHFRRVMLKKQFFTHRVTSLPQEFSDVSDRLRGVFLVQMTLSNQIWSCDQAVTETMFFVKG